MSSIETHSLCHISLAHLSLSVTSWPYIGQKLTRKRAQTGNPSMGIANVMGVTLLIIGIQIIASDQVASKGSRGFICMSHLWIDNELGRWGEPLSDMCS